MRERNPVDVLKSFAAQYPTRKEAAAALGISQSHLTALILGRATFSERMLAKLGLRRTTVTAA
jgi:plasmid maintenance system antidote protein VapI